MTLLIREMSSERCGTDLFRGQRREHHPRGVDTDAGNTDQEFEEFTLVTGRESVEQLHVFSFAQVVVDVERGLLLSLEHLVGLQGNQDPESDSVVVQNDFRRGKSRDGAFDVVDHNSTKIGNTL